jgi:hypothetical protein
MRTAGGVFSDVLLHHDSAIRGCYAVILCAVSIGQGHTAGTRDELKDQVLD